MQSVDLTIDDLNLTKTQIRKIRKRERKNRNKPIITAGSLELKEIKPITQNQRLAFDSFDDGKNLLLHGLPGTGKTYISLYLALKESLNPNNRYTKVLIARSVVPTREMGFLPGSMEQKSEVFETPYKLMISDLFNNSDAYGILKNKEYIEFMTTSFVRGITIDNAILIVDEMQNMSWQELHSLITRMGMNSRIIFCGDISQDDLSSERYNEKTGIIDFMNVLLEMDEFEHIDFTEHDIVRSGLVKSYILACNKLGY